MQRCFALLTALLLLALALPGFALAPTAPPDTIIVKLPNQAVMTLYVKNRAQLHQLRTYKLDSLMGVLDDYITKAEAAGRNSTAEEVTLEYYPARDHPGTGAPEQIRITVRSADAPGQPRPPAAERVDVSMGRLFGVTVEDRNGNGDRVSVRVGRTPASDSLRDAERRARQEKRANRPVHHDFGVDLGLNALTNKAVPAGELAPDLRPFGSRYISFNYHYQVRLGGRGSPLYLVTGPELAFNNYMLDNNQQFFATTDDRTLILRSALDLQKSKLATSAINLPLLAQLDFKSKKGRDAFRLAGGGFIGYRLGSHTKLKYERDGHTRKDKDRGSYNLQDFQYGVQGLIGIGGIDLFVKYNLNELFKDNRGPQAQTISFGISL